MDTYKITWTSGKVEEIEAEAMGTPTIGHRYGDRSIGQQHFQFYRKGICILSIRECDVISVRLVENPPPPPAPRFRVTYSTLMGQVSAMLRRDNLPIYFGSWADTEEESLSSIFGQIIK